jgi:hypothetical protein
LEIIAKMRPTRVHQVLVRMAELAQRLLTSNTRAGVWQDGSATVVRKRRILALTIRVVMEEFAVKFPTCCTSVHVLLDGLAIIVNKKLIRVRLVRARMAEYVLKSPI